MRVLLDANLPRGLARLLIGHEAHSVHQRRWSDLDDGALLDACMNEYSALVTLDQSLPFQQNLRGLPDLEPLVPALLAGLSTAKSGDLAQVGV